MKNLINIVIIFCSTFLSAQSYPRTIVFENDTIICFTTAQSKQMAVWNEQRKQCQELRILDGKEIQKKDGIIAEQSKIIEEKDSIIYNCRNIIVQKDKIISLDEEERKLLKKEIRTQKLGKWIAIISGVLLSGLIIAI